MKLEKYDSSNRLVCECGFSKKVDYKIIASERYNSKSNVGGGILKVENKEGFPHKCKKCGYEECEIEDLGASYSDESNIYLFKCKKCGYVERQAEGSSNK